MFVVELPRFSPDTGLSFGEIDQFATMTSDIMVIWRSESVKNWTNLNHFSDTLQCISPKLIQESIR